MFFLSMAVFLGIELAIGIILLFAFPLPRYFSLYKPLFILFLYWMVASN